MYLISSFENQLIHMQVHNIIYAEYLFCELRVNAEHKVHYLNLICISLDMSSTKFSSPAGREQIS